VAVVKADCPTCQLVAPVLGELDRRGLRLAVASQDDPGFPAGVEVVDDTGLEWSWALSVDTVPTLVRMKDGVATDRVVGWSRPAWESLTGLVGLGAGLPEQRPGCGSLTTEPGVAEALLVRHGAARLAARRVELGELEDEHEALFGRGWTDGLPVVPPTEARVLRMLEGTSRRPDEVVAEVPPDLAPCTVEKVAVNAVMAGCRPEYLPVVLAAVEAACTTEFNIHGVLATTYFAGPVVIVNGPVRTRIGMNSGVNALGQGSRANSSIGRALQLVIRNVGGGRPGEVDRATLGNPGKVGFCFAEDEESSPWEPLAVERGLAEGSSAVTLFAGEGVRGIIDQRSRAPESLARSFAACLRTVAHPKLALGIDALLVVSPEHARVFAEAGWTKARLRRELDELLSLPVEELAEGEGGMAEGIGRAVADRMAGGRLPKFRPGGLLIAHAGGTAGMFSAIIGGWVGGPTGSEPVTREVGS